MKSAVGAGSVTVSFRPPLEVHPASSQFDEVDADVLVSAWPWRTFRWSKGQKHYSGTYWSATECDHVVYESRLELTRLLFADFDPSVHRISAQPFLLSTNFNSAVRKHIPDYLLLTDTGPIVVDVKPAARLLQPEVVATFSWTRAAVEARGWRYEVWSEPPATELQNVRFLAGFRRENLFDPMLLADIRASDLDGAPVGEVCRGLPDRPAPLVRSGLFHLLWSQYFTVDLSRPLSALHLLKRRFTR